MTSSPTPMKFSRWAASGALAVLFLAVAGVGWIYYVNSIKETPTCISFKVAGTVDGKAKVLEALQGVVESAGMTLKAKHDASMVWEGPQTTVSYYSNLESGDYTIFVCTRNRDVRAWQEIAALVERALQGKVTTASAWLQRNNRDFKCDPNCTVQVRMPLDFEQLNRTVLARGS